MNRVMRVLLIVIMAGMIALPTAALAGPKMGGILKVGESADLNNVDPHRGVSKISGKILTMICEGLVMSGLDGSPTPALATSWELSEGGKVWTFKLVKDAKWHNGRAMVAKDIKWNFERMLDKKTRSPWRGRFAIIDQMEVVDDNTLKFFLKRPSVGFPATMYSAASAQVPMCAPESVGADGKLGKLIGTGPFMFGEWKQNEYFKALKNPNYRKAGIPRVDQVLVKFIPEETTRLSALQSGELDIALDLGVYEVMELAKKPPKGVVFIEDNASSMGFIHFNCGKKPFNDIRVRQAVSLAINKQDIAQSVWADGAVWSNQPMMPASPFKLDVPDVKRDVPKAKKLLAEAGYPKGMDIVLSTSSGYWQYLIAVEVIMEQLKEAGIRISLDTSDWPTYVGKCLKGAFTMGYAGWPLDFDPVFTYEPCFTPTGAYSFLTARAYDNPELTQILKDADKAVDLAERKKIFAKAVGIITHDAPWIFVGYGPSPLAIRDTVKDFRSHISGLFISPEAGYQYLWLDK